METVLIKAVDTFALILEVLVLVRVIASWLPVGRNHKLMQLLQTVTEPVLGPIRSLLQKSPLGGSGMMLDFSPIIAYMFIRIANVLLVNLIQMIF